ncbi:menaquinone biosynthetic enzyme MqnA/MqnD family protein [Geobacter sp. AOG2]|uniref:menaquinone biosynthetic enzyme MqnA/MqnD family protein n=1 Tax=Geobacter sp. AOG2 TaxID=1566347 RepID=UPI00208154C8|nr:menaquinone biosynthesis protein [Geobacter sp. AOG2]GFE60867.1 chorismate dehydratase [Geobacter sp. AOG2]
MLTIGRIDYANVTPLFHALKAHFPCDGYRFTAGVPARLNAMLAAEEIDVCPSSSIEYAIHSERYLILPDLSISSVGPVASVLLFSRVPIEELDGKEVLLSAESATSVNLLRILLGKCFGQSCRYTVSSSPLTEALRTAPAMLLIGDAALRSSMSETGLRIYDLGSLWYEWTGLPFVFALWFCTRAAVRERYQEVRLLADQLVQAKGYADQEREFIADAVPEMAWMGREGLIRYWRENISYELGGAQQEGLRLFYRYAAELGLIPHAPELHFFK